ncbi:hypothetical protein U3516DRAFT_827458 [Neocallimastix sp. 'constans']
MEYINFNIMNMDEINIFDSYEDNHLYPRSPKKKTSLKLKSKVKVGKSKKTKSKESSGVIIGIIIGIIILIVIAVCIYYIIKKRNENKKKRNVVVDGGEECENVVVDGENSNDAQNQYPQNYYSPVMTNQNQIPNLTGLSTEPTVPVNPETITGMPMVNRDVSPTEADK